MVNQLSVLQKLRQKGAELRKKGAELMTLWAEICELSKEYETSNHEERSDDVQVRLQKVEAENQRLKAKLAATELKLRKMTPRPTSRPQNDVIVINDVSSIGTVAAAANDVIVETNGDGLDECLSSPPKTTGNGTVTDNGETDAEPERVTRKRKSSNTMVVDSTEKRTRPSRAASSRSLRSSADTRSPAPTPRSRETKPTPGPAPKSTSQPAKTIKNSESNKLAKSSSLSHAESLKSAKDDASSSDSSSERRTRRGMPTIKLQEPKIKPDESGEVDVSALENGDVDLMSVDWSESVALQIAADTTSQVYRCMMCCYPPFKRPGDLVRHIKLKHSNDWV